MGHTYTTSPRKIFGPKLECNKDPSITPPKMDITNLITFFVYPESEVIKTNPFHYQMM
jgi:hypothetical protein